MTPAERQAKKLAARQKKLAQLIHRWAYTDSKKYPKKFETLFNKIYDFHKEKERQ